MLIRFAVKNFLSFREEQSLSMVKGKESRLKSHVNEDKTAGLQTLRGAVIYGANASGKSNLIEAMRYAQLFIVANNKNNIDKAFRLSEINKVQPSSFNFEFKINNNAYSYGFESKGKNIISEWLYQINSKAKDTLIFKRSPKTGDKANIEFNFSHKLLKEISDKEKEDLKSLARFTPDDTLFMYDAKIRTIKLFLEPLKWFENSLMILRPNSSLALPVLAKKLEEDKKFYNYVSKLLKNSDTGIDHIKCVRDSKLLEEIPNETLEEIKAVEENEATFVFMAKRIMVTKKQNELIAHKFVTVHKSRENKEIEFELENESDGTNKLIDLSFAFFFEDVKDRVLVIDELDRSLHPAVTEMLHDIHYSNPHLDSQLIIATHEHYLLKQDCYRRDEIWFVEKNAYGESRLYSLSEYRKIRHDKDIEKDYLLGRFGAVPYIRRAYAKA